MGIKVASLTSKAKVASMGPARLAELEKSLGIEKPKAKYTDRIEEAWEILEAVKAYEEAHGKLEDEDEDDEEDATPDNEADEDEDEADEDEDEDDEDPTAKQQGLEVGGKVRFFPLDADTDDPEEKVKGRILKISQDGTSVKIKDMEGQVHNGIAPKDCEAIKPKVQKQVKKTPAKASSNGNGDGDEDDNPLLSLALKLNNTKPKALASFLADLDDNLISALDELPEPQKRSGGRKGQGVQATIIRVLTEATKKRPVTKDDIHAILVDEFPNNSPTSMMSTVAKIPWTLIHQGGIEEDRIHSRSIDGAKKGYWMDAADDDGE